METGKVLYKLMNQILESFWDRVSLENVEYMTDLKEAIKERRGNDLKYYNAVDLTLKITKKDDKKVENAVKLDDERELTSILRDFETMFLNHYSKDEISKLFANRIRVYVYPPAGKYHYFVYRG